MKTAYNVRSLKACEVLTEQLAEKGYVTPLDRKPQILCNKWCANGRSTVIFIGTGIVTYGNLDDAYYDNVEVKRFTPKNTLKGSAE